ncbi:MAG: prepilin-type N-terminal cleavage/methylation domain-containing protein [Patescibacteria group bacterium]
MNLSKNLQPTTHNLKPNRGFTLIELLVVVAIIGTVSGIIMTSVNNSKAKGRDSKRIADISVIQLALERYYDINKSYPDSLSDLDDSVPKKDPQNADYSYGCASSCQSYALNATLELSNGILDDDAISGNGLIYDVAPKF